MELIVTILISFLCLVTLGFCVARIFSSIVAESKYRAVLSQNAPYASISGEPFTGSLYLCALLVYIYGSAYDAEHEMRYSFRKRFHADWGTYCRAAESLHTSLNGDLLVECLAALLSKNAFDRELLEAVFSTLSAAECVWNEGERGTKPSIYLARLLDYTIEDDSLAEAYRTLGLKKGATLSQVKAAHRKLVAQYHPDRVNIPRITIPLTKKTSSPTTAAEELEVFMKIQKAYEEILGTFIVFQLC